MESISRHKDEFHGLTKKRVENKKIASLKNEHAILRIYFIEGGSGGRLMTSGWPKPLTSQRKDDGDDDVILSLRYSC